MNLILLQPTELVSSDETKTGDVRRREVLLSANDARTRHGLLHLRKRDGDQVNVGIVGGAKGRAVVVMMPYHSIRPRPTTNATKDTAAGDVAAQQQMEPQPQGGLKLVLQFDSSSNLAQQLPPSITLILALPFPKRLKALWSTVASMGVVTRIVIVRGQLSDPQHASTTALHASVYEQLLLEGMSQGGHTRPVRVEVLVDDNDEDGKNDKDDKRSNSSNHRIRKRLQQMIQPAAPPLNDGSSSAGNGCSTTSSATTTTTTIAPSSACCAKIFLDCGDEGMTPPPPVREVVLSQCRPTMIDPMALMKDDDNHCHQSSKRTKVPLSLSPSPCTAMLAVGPERGWTDDEAKFFRHELGFQSASLGPSILRVDTAVVAGLALVSAALDEVAGDAAASRNSSTW